MLTGLAQARAPTIRAPQKARKKLADDFMELKLSPRMFDALTAQLRTHVGEIRQIEKEIMSIAVRDAGMPRKDFIGSFPRNETSARWIARHIKAGKKYSAPLAASKRKSSAGRRSCRRWR